MFICAKVYQHVTVPNVCAQEGVIFGAYFTLRKNGHYATEVKGR